MDEQEVALLRARAKIGELVLIVDDYVAAVADRDRQIITLGQALAAARAPVEPVPGGNNTDEP